MSAISDLIDALKRLPSVGNKSAQRMAFHLLERDREGALKLAKALQHAVDKVGHCGSCRTLSETELCSICTNPQRHTSELCVVETPADLQALEAASVRMRPILMTSVATVAGAMPLVFAHGAGAQSRFTIGIAIAFGVGISTFLTLIVVPTIYAKLASWTRSPGARAQIIERAETEAQPEAVG